MVFVWVRREVKGGREGLCGLSKYPGGIAIFRALLRFPYWNMFVCVGYGFCESGIEDFGAYLPCSYMEYSLEPIPCTRVLKMLCSLDPISCSVNQACIGVNYLLVALKQSFGLASFWIYFFHQVFYTQRDKNTNLIVHIKRYFYPSVQTNSFRFLCTLQHTWGEKGQRFSGWLRAQGDEAWAEERSPLGWGDSWV